MRIRPRQLWLSPLLFSLIGAHVVAQPPAPAGLGPRASSDGAPVPTPAAFSAPAAPERATTFDGTYRSYYPAGLYMAGSAYDPVRKRLIVFGGANEAGPRNETWALSLTGNAVWTQLLPAGNPPPARENLSMIYDSARDRVVIFGGYDGTNRYRDVWALTLSGTPTWTDITPPGGVLTGPTARYYHTAIYDPLRDRMIVLGGYDSFYLNDVWSLPFAGTPAWTQLIPAGTTLTAFVNHTSIYDPVRDRMLTFGGYDGTNRHNETYALSLGATPAWSLIATAGAIPPPIVGMGGVYDSAHDRLVCFGGYDAVNYYESQTWGLTLSGTPTWTVLAGIGTGPGGRSNGQVIYDPNGDRLIASEGTYGPNGLIYQSYDDHWALSLGASPAWTRLPPGADVPAGRTSPWGIVDAPNRRFLLFGGSPLTGTMPNDVRAFSLGAVPTWTVLAGAGPGTTTLSDALVFYDSRRARMVVFGSDGGVLQPSEFWTLSLTGTPVWTQYTPTGTPPSSRIGITSVYDSKNDRILVFGGHWYPNDFNDVFALSLAGTPAWTQLTPTGTPPSGREYATGMFDPVRNRLLIYGGYAPVSVYDMYALNLGPTPGWVQLSPAGSGPLSGGRQSVYDPVRDRMLIQDGALFALSMTGTPTWSQLALAGAPQSRTNGAVAYDPVVDQLLVSCGQGQDNVHDFGSLFWGTPIAGVEGEAAIARFALGAPRPNPSRAATRFDFEVPWAARVWLTVHDVQGREVRRLEDAAFAPGRYSRSWDGADAHGAPVAPGLYFIRLEAPGATFAVKAVRLR